VEFIIANQSQLADLFLPMHSEILSDANVNNLISLAEATVGCDFRIRFLAGPACEQLRRLGFCESLQVRKIANGRNLICSISGTRMAVSRELAQQVQVTPLFAA